MIGDGRKCFVLVRKTKVADAFDQIAEIVGPFDAKRTAEQWAEDKADKWQYVVIELKIP